MAWKGVGVPTIFVDKTGLYTIVGIIFIFLCEMLYGNKLVQLSTKTIRNQISVPI